jgi:uncharacterized protein YaaN involved in tellurite resistance
MVKIEPTMTQSEFKEFLVEYEKAGQMIRSLTTSLNTANQKINEQTTLIEQLSKDNLALVARIDEIIAISCPNSPNAQEKLRYLGGKPLPADDTYSCG